jgi:hypothetical protein
MKKRIDDKSLQNTNLNLQNIYFSDHIKTTNINILLNRVKIEKKNDFKKKILFSFLMVVVISVISIVTISN